MHVDFFCHTIQYGRQAAILLLFFHVQSHNSDMSQLISFKVGTRNIDLCHTYVHRFVLRCYFIWPFYRHFCFILHRSYIKVAVKARNCIIADFFQSWYKDIDVRHTYACWFVIIQSNCDDFFMSRAITQTCLNWFHSKLVQGHRPMSYICMSICFAIQYNITASMMIFSCPELLFIDTI